MLRLQMTVSLLSTMTEGVQTQNMFPLYILLAKPLSDTAFAGVCIFLMILSILTYDIQY